MSILSVRDIRKSYGPVQALKGLSIEVPEGAVFGILGPNGSGKTTLLGILLNVLTGDSGSYQWFGGMSPQAARREIGALLETPNFYHYLNADQNLQINAAIKQRGAADIDRVLGIIGLRERRSSKFSTYSLGMKQRLAIGNALLGKPKVLVLDEPTNGLDPAGISEIRSLIRALRAEGITIIIASHLLDEIEKVCTHMAILKRGQLLVTGTVAEVLRAEDQIEIAAKDMAGLMGILQAMPGIQGLQKGDATLLMTAANGLQPEAVNRYCMDRGIVLSQLQLRRKSLENTFMELTGGDTA